MVNGEAATEKKLYDAASKGDLPTFQLLLQGDPYLLDGVSFAGSRSLLHIATLYGQAAIVEEVLRIHPELARSLDSQNSSPLHIASAKGNLEIAKMLLLIAPEMCWWRSCQGMNPVHVAAINGHVDILQELIRVDPFPAMEKADRGQTVLHLCVKHRQPKALEFLVGKLNDAFIETKNDDGQTLLHLAAGYKDVKMVKFLVENTEIPKQSVDSMGRTAWSIAESEPGIRQPWSIAESEPGIRQLLFGLKSFIPIEVYNRLSDVTMVVVVLITTMAFQAAVSPPGGVWQDDSTTHKAGEAVMASNRPKIYKSFVRANTTAFVSSLVAIFLLFLGYNTGDSIIFTVFVFSAVVAMASIAVSYGGCITVITPDNETHSLAHVISVVVGVSLGIIGFAILSLNWTEIVELLGKWLGNIKERLAKFKERLMMSRTTFVLGRRR